MKAESVVAFTNVNVVPMDTERILEKQTVIIRNGQISEIGPTTAIKVPAGSLQIDGRGKYLLPGLIDMHTHLYSPVELQLYAANGVTTVFNLDGRPDHLLWREKVVKGELFGSTIYTCGPKFDQPRTAEEDIKLVNEQVRAGYDGIKIYNQVSKAEYPALISTAKKNNLIIVGHVARDVGFESTVKSGQSIAHAEEFFYTFFDNKSDETLIPQAVTLTRAAGIWVTPTLVTYDSIVRQVADLPGFLANPNLKYISPIQNQRFQPERNVYFKGFSQSEIPKLKDTLAFQKKLVKALHDAGVPILVGTDSSDVGPVAGFSVHQEMQNFIEIGFTPYEALSSATRQSAEALKASDKFGTISVGKRADLILTEENPLKSIDTVAHPEGIMLRGKWLTKTDIQKMMEDIPQFYAGEEKSIAEKLENNPSEALRYLEENDPFNRLAGTVLAHIALTDGIIKLKEVFQNVRKINPNSSILQESTINSLGYGLLSQKKIREAIEIFQQNVEIYSQSANTYDSLADAYNTDGNIKLAIEYYKKALDINPNYPNANFAKKYITENSH